MPDFVMGMQVGGLDEEDAHPEWLAWEHGSISLTAEGEGMKEPFRWQFHVGRANPPIGRRGPPPSKPSVFHMAK
jgi:hypothetical protein